MGILDSLPWSARQEEWTQPSGSLVDSLGYEMDTKDKPSTKWEEKASQVKSQGNSPSDEGSFGAILKGLACLCGPAAGQ